MSKSTNICEIFSSIQGEGRYVGEKQIFIRFCGCNLHCAYCDTLHQIGKSYTCDDVIAEIQKYDLKTVHSISLTGGEPLLNTTFIKELSQKIEIKLYLETNGTLYNELKEVINNVDIVAADIKLNSCAKQNNLFKEHKKFLEICKRNNKETFLKIVFDENITQEEIETSTKLAQQFGYEIFLQPKMTETDFDVDLDFILDIFEKFKQLYPKVRFVPQMHKFWDVR